MKHPRYLPVFAGISAATLVMSNVFGNRLVDCGLFVVPAALFVFPLAYVVGDVVTWVYGYANARRVIWTSVAMNILYVAIAFVVRAMPSPTGSSAELAAAYDAVLLPSARISLASIIALFAGDFANAYVVAKLKLAKDSQQMGYAFIASTAVGQAIDNSIFLPLALGGLLPVSALAKTWLVTWLAKVVWEIIALPLTTRVVTSLAKIEGSAAYDSTTEFNPFRGESDGY